MLQKNFDFCQIDPRLLVVTNVETNGIPYLFLPKTRARRLCDDQAFGAERKNIFGFSKVVEVVLYPCTYYTNVAFLPINSDILRIGSIIACIYVPSPGLEVGKTLTSMPNVTFIKIELLLFDHTPMQVIFKFGCRYFSVFHPSVPIWQHVCTMCLKQLTGTRRPIKSFKGCGKVGQPIHCRPQLF